MESISNLFKSKATPSRIIAKDRLIVTLAQDRINCSPQILEIIKVEIIKVISNYVYVDEDTIDIQISKIDAENPSNGTVLFANIPIRGTRKVPRRT
ncbi:MAG: cell division topological specificity factor MinE [Firmicutes bacterium]|nr:cell division topological specificity factor MinE [Bacillota bacterium]